MWETLVGAFVGLLCVGVAVLVYRMRPSELGLLWLGGGDLTPVVGVLKGVLDGYDITYNASLGFPGFLDAAQWPLFTDAYHWLHLVPMAWVFSDAVSAVNAYAFVGFFEVALVAYLLLRRLGVFWSGALVLSAALTLLPWHFARAPSHIFLANYAPAIVGIGLVVAVWRGYFDRAVLPRVVGGLALALVAGVGGIYYAFMTSLLLAVVLGMRIVSRVVSRNAAPVGWITALVAIAVPAFTVMSIVVSRAVQHAATVAPHSRFSSESTLYGGSPASLFLPDVRSVFARLLAGLRPDIGGLLTFTEGTAAFNVVIIVALIVVLGVLVIGLFRPAHTPTWRRGQRQTGYLQSLLLIVLFMFATMGGGVLFAHLVTPEIRAWGRYSVYIAVLAALAAGVLATELFRTRRRWRAGLATAAAALLAIETLTLGFANYANTEELDHEIRPFVKQLEEKLAEGCPILQLPLHEYPEAGPVNKMGDYDLMIPYLVSEDLRWSYGGFKLTQEGRWGLDMRDDIQALADAAQREGFCGVLVDSTSYASPADLQRYTSVLGAPDLVSQGERWLFFEWLDSEVVPTVTPASGFSGAEGSPVDPFWWQVEPHGTVALSGVPAGARSLELEFGPTPCGPVTMLIDGQTLSVDGGRQWFEIPVDVETSGQARLDIEVTTPGCTVPNDPRVFYVAMFDGAPGEIPRTGP
jgi:hypothetical protein